MVWCGVMQCGAAWCDEKISSPVEMCTCLVLVSWLWWVCPKCWLEVFATSHLLRSQPRCSSENQYLLAIKRELLFILAHSLNGFFATSWQLNNNNNMRPHLLRYRCKGRVGATHKIRTLSNQTNIFYKLSLSLSVFCSLVLSLCCFLVFSMRIMTNANNNGKHWMSGGWMNSQSIDSWPATTECE